MSPDPKSLDGHAVVSRNEWLAARKQLLAREKAHTHESDALARERQRLPWVRVDKRYVFDTPQGKKTLADLFDGRSQLVVYHFMFGPEWAEGCPSCSYLSDHYDGAIPHLAQRDVTFAVVSRAPLAKIEAFKKRMGWKFPWASSHGTDFNADYHVSFSPEAMAMGQVEYNFALGTFPSEEAPGVSVFFKNAAGEVFHTYSTYGRGLDHLVGAYAFLDLVPKGRDEEGLSFPMAWVKHHDKYPAPARSA